MVKFVRWSEVPEVNRPWGSNHLLRMVMDPRFYEEVIGHPKHHLRI